MFESTPPAGALNGPVPPAYYEKLGLATDALMRCAECHRLVPVATLRAKGCCPHCGNRRVKEIQTLTVWEWVKIRVGLLRFPHRLAFLREFNRG